MNVIFKKAFLFQKDKIVEDAETKRRVQIVEDQFLVYPNLQYTPQSVPDWIKETELFKLAEKDGALVETVKGPPSPEEQEQESQEKHPAGPKGATAGLPQHGSSWKK